MDREDRGLQLLIVVSARATGLITISNGTPVDLLLARQRCPLRHGLDQREQRTMLARWGAALTASLVAARAARLGGAASLSPPVWFLAGDASWAQMWGVALRGEGAWLVLPAEVAAEELTPSTTLLTPMPHREGFAACHSLSVVFSDATRGAFNNLYVCDGVRDDDYALVWDYGTQPQALRVWPLYDSVREWVQSIATTEEWAGRFQYSGAADEFIVNHAVQVAP